VYTLLTVQRTKQPLTSGAATLHTGAALLLLASAGELRDRLGLGSAVGAEGSALALTVRLLLATWRCERHCMAPSSLISQLCFCS
jgi:hypothetical protein